MFPTRSSASLALLVGLMLASGPALFGQIGVGSVTGTITDPHGAFVPNASITLINPNTNLASRASTNQSGSYIFTSVRPGTYRLSVELLGFRTAQIPPFDVGVNQTITHNVTLSVGEITEMIEVTGEAELLQQASSELGTVIQERPVTELPLNGRNFTQLLLLTPGASPVFTAQGSTVGSYDGNASGVPDSQTAVHASMHGQAGRSVVYFTDGIINTDFRVQTYAQLPNIDLIQEFKVQAHNDKVEFGGVTGGVVNLVSKSGGNRIRGSLFEFVRNNAFDARNPFSHATLKSPPAFRQNQFGASVSGPIIRNRTFYSGGYDGWRYIRYGTTRSRVPNEKELFGNFQGSIIGRNIYNPFTTRLEDGKQIRDPFPGNVIPANLISPMVQKFFQTYGTAPNYVDPVFNYFFVNRSKDVSNNWSVKVDHRLGDRDNAFFRVSRMTTENLAVGENSTTRRPMTALSYGGGLIHMFRPTLILDVRGGTSGRDFKQFADHTAGLEPMKALKYGDIDRFQGLTLSLQSTWTGVGVGGPQVRSNPTWNIGANLSWIKNSHNLKMGYQWISFERLQINQGQNYAFNDSVTSHPQLPSTTGASLASALLGLPSRFSGTLPEAGKVNFALGAGSAYFQDEWKVTPTLTVNAGIRFDYTTQPVANQIGPMAGIDLATGNWLIGAKAMPPPCNETKQAPCIPGNGLQNVPFGDKIKLADHPVFIPKAVWDNWGPRASVAWRMNSKSVLRAGYGLVWDSLTAKTQYPQHNLEWRWPSTQGFSGVANDIGEAPKFIQDFQGTFPGVLPEASPWTSTGWMNDPERKNGYSHQWNVEIQRQMADNLMFSVAYVGSSNGRLEYAGMANMARTAGPGTPAQVAARRPVPHMGGEFRYSQSIGSSNYNSLQVKADRRFTNGFQTLVAYTWSKSIDNTSGWFNAEEGQGNGNQYFLDPKANRGVSGFDVPHVLSWFFVYELPAGPGKPLFSSGPAAWILGKWQVNSILTARSGQVYGLTVNGDIANVGTGAINYGRPNLIGNPHPGKRTETAYYDKAAFAIPTFEFGNLGRNALRGEPVVGMDSSLFKTVPIGESKELQVRIESFNTFNIMVWGIPGRTIGTAGAGRITSVTTRPRELQFGARFSF